MTERKRITEIVTLSDLEGQPLFEMALEQKEVREEIVGLRRPINLHLVKLLAADMPSTTRNHWKVEVAEWLAQIGVLRLKPTTRPGKVEFYFNLLYEFAYGDLRTNAIVADLQRVSKVYSLKRTMRVDAISERLRAFHEGFAKLCAAGYDDEKDAVRLRELLDTLD